MRRRTRGKGRAEKHRCVEERKKNEKKKEYRETR